MVIVFSLIICAGAGLMIAAMGNRRRMREMTHRERLAMIDRGLVPALESDPLGRSPHSREERGVRYRTAGVLMIGLGLGLAVLIGFAAGQFDIGFGIGGGFAMLGGASLLNYHLMSRVPEDPLQRW